MPTSFRWATGPIKPAPLGCRRDPASGLPLPGRLILQAMCRAKRIGYPATPTRVRPSAGMEERRTEAPSVQFARARPCNLQTGTFLAGQIPGNVDHHDPAETTEEQVRLDQRGGLVVQ